MEPLSTESFNTLVERAGLNLTPEDAVRLKPLFETYLERLQALHAADLDDEEVSGRFIPSQDSALGVGA